MWSLYGRPALRANSESPNLRIEDDSGKASVHDSGIFHHDEAESVTIIFGRSSKVNDVIVNSILYWTRQLRKPRFSSSKSQSDARRSNRRFLDTESKYLTLWPTVHVERGSSVGRMPDSQPREPGFESPLLQFRSLGIFFHFTTPQSTQLYK